MTTPILGMDELAAAQSQPEVIVNAALRTLEAAINISALGYQNDPPGSPEEGHRYLVGDTPTGAWAGHAEEVAYYSGGWQFLEPLPGWRAFVVDDGEYAFDSTSGYWAPGGEGATGRLLTTRTAAGTTDTLVLDDSNNVVETTNASAVAVTVPANADVAIPVGATVIYRQIGAGQASFTGDTGVTIDCPAALNPVTREQYSTVALTKRATNTWIISGDLDIAT